MDQSALVMGAMLYPEMLPEVDSEEKSLPNTAKKQLLTEPADADCGIHLVQEIDA